MMDDRSRQRIHWRPILAELLGTAVLLLVGLSLVILMFGAGSPVVRVVPDEGLRQLITGFLIGTTGALIALSPVGRKAGRTSTGRHLGVLADGKLDSRMALSYDFAQLVGASVGALPLLGWGAMGRSVAFGATLSGEGYTLRTILMGEVITTFALIGELCVSLGIEDFFLSPRRGFHFSMP